MLKKSFSYICWDLRNIRDLCCGHNPVSTGGERQLHSNTWYFRCHVVVWCQYLACNQCLHGVTSFCKTSVIFVMFWLRMFMCTWVCLVFFVWKKLTFDDISETGCIIYAMIKIRVRPFQQSVFRFKTSSISSLYPVNDMQVAHLFRALDSCIVPFGHPTTPWA